MHIMDRIMIGAFAAVAVCIAAIVINQGRAMVREGDRAAAAAYATAMIGGVR